MKKIIKVAEFILLFFFLILLPFLKDKLAIFLSIPLLVGIYFLMKKENIKHFSLFLFVISFVIRLISIIYLKIEIVDDFKTMLDASRSLLHNDLSFTNEFYFMAFPYQLGHVLYQAFLLKIINSVFFLKVVNSLITSFIVVFIYLITKEMVQEKTARLISIMYLLYFYPLYLNSVLTNQHLPALLILISVYLLFKKSSMKDMILIAILLGIANFFRTESIIFVVGIALYKLLDITRENKKEVLTSTVILILGYFVFTNFLSLLVYVSPINKKLTNSYPEWKFYCGLSSKYNGIYNEEDQQIFFASENKKELLVDRIKEEKFKLPILFLKKEVILWTQTNYDLRISNNLNPIFLLFNQGYLNLLILLFVIALVPSKEIDRRVLLIKILLGLYYGIYLFIEISPRYAYILHILIFLLLGIGLEKLENKFRLSNN